MSLNNLTVLPPQLALLSNLVVLNLWGNQVPRSSPPPNFQLLPFTLLLPPFLPFLPSFSQQLLCFLPT